VAPGTAEGPIVQALFRRARISRRRPRLAVSLLAALIVGCQAAIAFAATDPSGSGAAPSATAAGPDTSIDSGPTGATNTASPSFAFSSPLGFSSFTCRLDAARFAPCTSPRSFSGLSDGPHTFYARAADRAGPVDPTPASTTFVVDTVAPPASVDSGPDGPTNDPRPKFDFSSTDDSTTFACSIDAGVPSFGPCSGDGADEAAEDLADGPYTFRVQAADAAGNTTPVTREFSVDTEAPSLSLDSGPSGATHDPRPAFEFSSTDEAASFVCSLETRAPSFRECSGDGTDRPETDLVDGSYTFSIKATDPAGNSTPLTRDFSVAAEKPDTAEKRGQRRKAPHPVPAWYMTARGAKDLRRQARGNACAFARRQSNRTRVLLMDFGKSERKNGNWGAQLRTGPHFANQTILDALKAAAHSYRNHRRCYSRGSVRITYGNTNNVPGWMRPRTIREAGRRQAKMSKRLSTYQRRHSYGHEGVAVAGDIEPQWSRPKESKALVGGATRGGKGGLFFNYGAASECPPEGKSCANHWDYRDLAKVSYGGVKRALPEIYRSVHVKQWSKVRRRWDRRHRKGKFCFSGATATAGFPVSIRQSWKKLRRKNDCVRRELVNIQEG